MNNFSRLSGQSQVVLPNAAASTPDKSPMNRTHQTPSSLMYLQPGKYRQIVINIKLRESVKIVDWKWIIMLISTEMNVCDTVFSCLLNHLT